MINENKYFETILSQPALDYLFKFWNSLEHWRGLKVVSFITCKVSLYYWYLCLGDSDSYKHSNGNHIYWSSIGSGIYKMIPTA